ncbi:hypothetical protein Glove_194g186 [Diversispora epigaea]|uniref:Uncharacterized protein n=1 Tax=Diversispora epigaea TaxID=1348612 RepID=A0A397ISK3_9GLOM|nr:hypothetical protein Glove_194g186 [Diversispora epigaea]
MSHLFHQIQLQTRHHYISPTDSFDTTISTKDNNKNDNSLNPNRENVVIEKPLLGQMLVDNPITIVTQFNGHIEGARIPHGMCTGF